MYNAEQKQRFINECYTEQGMRIEAKRIFELFEQYEEEWGDDLCTRDINELSPVYSKLTGLRRRSSIRPRAILIRYSEWCMANGVRNAKNVAVKLEDTMVDKYRTMTVANPRQLQVFLNQICLPEDAETVDNSIRAYCWLAFSGLENEDIFGIKAGDIDFSEMSVNYQGASYPIYREGIASLKNCAKMQSYAYYNNNYAVNKITRKPRGDSDQLIRGYSSRFTVATMRTELSRRVKRVAETGAPIKQLSYYRIWISGSFYRIYEDELAGIIPSFTYLVDKKVGDKVYKLDTGRNTQHAKRKAIEREYAKDYASWKQSFT